jgi:Fic family protein
MMVDLYRHFDAPLTDDLPFRWHEMLMNGRRDVKEVGRYRTDESPMQVVSGPLHAPTVHFEAPPSPALPKEMKRFIQWFERTAPKGKTPLRVLARAGIAHLYFVSIHPFEDGNGRIGRAIAEKVVSQGLGQASLIALSHTINSKRKAYYDMLERSNRRNEITEWLVYFAKTVLEAQEYAQGVLDFLIAKTKFFDRFRGQFNERQEKVVTRMFREGPNGFKGGLSAENYIRITGTSRATATRDLQDLVDKQALARTGSLKSTRYHLNIELSGGATRLG